MVISNLSILATANFSCVLQEQSRGKQKSGMSLVTVVIALSVLSWSLVSMDGGQGGKLCVCVCACVHGEKCEAHALLSFLER